MDKVITPVNAEGRAHLGIRAGDTVRVIQNIIEIKKKRGTDKKEKTTKSARTQAFEGILRISNRPWEGICEIIFDKTTSEGGASKNHWPLLIQTSARQLFKILFHDHC